MRSRWPRSPWSRSGSRPASSRSSCKKQCAARAGPPPSRRIGTERTPLGFTRDPPAGTAARGTAGLRGDSSEESSIGAAPDWCSRHPAQDEQTSRGRSVRVTCGGERGIRTLDELLAHTPLAGVRLRPLGHLSGRHSAISPGAGVPGGRDDTGAEEARSKRGAADPSTVKSRLAPPRSCAARVPRHCHRAPRPTPRA
jgi:hypothetical protein